MSVNYVVQAVIEEDGEKKIKYLKMETAPRGVILDSGYHYPVKATFVDNFAEATFVPVSTHAAEMAGFVTKGIVADNADGRSLFSGSIISLIGSGLTFDTVSATITIYSVKVNLDNYEVVPFQLSSFRAVKEENKVKIDEVFWY